MGIRCLPNRDKHNIFEFRKLVFRFFALVSFIIANYFGPYHKNSRVTNLFPHKQKTMSRKKKQVFWMVI